MRRLDRKARFGTIHGTDAEFPNAVYHQNGATFDNEGNCVAVLTAKGPVAYTADMDSKPAEGSEPPAPAPQQQLSDKVTEIDKLKAEVSELEQKLDAAKAGEINNPEYTSMCASAQKALTQAKRNLTKAVNAAAVIETQMQNGDK